MMRRVFLQAAAIGVAMTFGAMAAVEVFGVWFWTHNVPW